MMQFGTPAWQAEGMMETFKMVEEGHEMTSSGDLEDFRKITGQEATSVSEWVKRNLIIKS